MGKKYKFLRKLNDLVNEALDDGLGIAQYNVSRTSNDKEVTVEIVLEPCDEEYSPRKKPKAKRDTEDDDD